MTNRKLILRTGLPNKKTKNLPFGLKMMVLVKISNNSFIKINNERWIAFFAISRKSVFFKTHEFFSDPVVNGLLITKIKIAIQHNEQSNQNGI